MQLFVTKTEKTVVYLVELAPYLKIPITKIKNCLKVCLKLSKSMIFLLRVNDHCIIF